MYLANSLKINTFSPFLREVLENPIQMSSELESLFSAQMEQLEKKEEEEKS